MVDWCGFMAIIDIIVGVKNEEEHIERCVRSLMEQTIKDIKILVVDGLSEDNTREIVRVLMEEDPRIKLLTNPLEKISSGRNTGLKASEADYVAYLDGHAFVGENWLLTLISSFKDCKKKYNLAGIGSTYASPEDDSMFGKTVAYCVQTGFGGLGTSFTEEKEIHPVETVAFALYKRSILVSEGIIYDEKMTHCEDTDFNHQLIKKGYILLKHPKALVYQYRRETLGKFFKQMINYGEGRSKLIKKYKEKLKIEHLISVFTVFYLLFLILSVILFLFNLINFFTLSLILQPTFIYIIIDLFYTFFIIVKYRDLKHIYAFLIFPAVHFGYGIGFIKGMVNN